MLAAPGAAVVVVGLVEVVVVMVCLNHRCRDSGC